MVVVCVLYLTREAVNAVARLRTSGKGMRLGGIALHTEVFKRSGLRPQALRTGGFAIREE